MRLFQKLTKMIEYKVCEINKNHYLKVLKCSTDIPEKRSSPKPREETTKRKPVIVIIPGTLTTPLYLSNKTSS